MSPEIPLACRLDALDAEERFRRHVLWQDLRGGALEIAEREGGFSFRFPSSAHVLSKLVEFVSLERVCCPFLHFEIDIHPGGGPLWLHVGGNAQVKAFLQETLARNPGSANG